MSPFTLANKSILFIGATSDIGHASAIECAKQGANLTITGRNLSRLNAIEKEIQEVNSDVNCQSLFFDIANDDQVEQFVTDLPSFDGIVFSVGTLETLPCKLHQKENIHNAMNVNFDGVVFLVATLLRKKKVKKGASIIFLSSVAGNLLAEKGNALYGASKAALSAYSKTLALELSNRKIRVNCILPGMVKTKFLENFSLEEEDFIADEKKYPLGYGTPEDVAYGVVYLLSDAARWITGTDLLMDGGRTLQ